MNCQRFETLLTDFLDETLDSHVRAAALSHLEECPSCTSLVDEVSRLCEELKNFPEISLPPDLVEQIIEQTSGEAPTFSIWQDYLLPAIRPFLTQRYAFATLMIFVFLSFAVNLAGPEFSAASLSPSSLVAKADHFSSQVYRKWAEFNDFKTRVEREFALLKEDLLGRLDYHLVTILFRSYNEAVEEESERTDDHRKVEGNSNHDEPN